MSLFSILQCKFFCDLSLFPGLTNFQLMEMPRRHTTPTLVDQCPPSVSTADNPFSSQLTGGKQHLHGKECHRRRRRTEEGRGRSKVATNWQQNADHTEPTTNGHNAATGREHDAHTHSRPSVAATASMRNCLCCRGRSAREWWTRTGRTRTTPMTTTSRTNTQSALSTTFFSSNSSSSFSSALLTLFSIIIIQQRVDNVGAVRCYCTDEHCVPYGVCEAAVCLVGLLRANNAVIRTCGNEALGCQRNLDRWSHICSCEEHFCNTFLFLRASTNIDGSGVAAAAMIGGKAAAGREQQQQQMSQDDRVFERMDPPPGEFATFDHQADDDERAPIKNSNLLTLLLVIVPLSVGAAAVVVVAINYYCHLC